MEIAWHGSLLLAASVSLGHPTPSLIMGAALPNLKGASFLFSIVLYTDFSLNISVFQRSNHLGPTAQFLPSLSQETLGSVWSQLFPP